MLTESLHTCTCITGAPNLYYKSFLKKDYFRKEKSQYIDLLIVIYHNILNGHPLYQDMYYITRFLPKHSPMLGHKVKKGRGTG